MLSLVGVATPSLTAIPVPVSRLTRLPHICCWFLAYQYMVAAARRHQQHLTVRPGQKVFSGGGLWVRNVGQAKKGMVVE